MAVIRGFQSANIIACFDEAPGGGDIFDLDAPRNAPAKTPAAHLDKLLWHSALFQYEIAHGPSDVAVTHTALATETRHWGVTGNTGGIIGGGSGASIDYAIMGKVRVTDILLVSHGLGYVPKAMVALDGRRLPTGYEIQYSPSEGSRQVSFYATSSGIYLRETAISGSTTLSAISRTYRVMVFRTRTPDPGQPLFGLVSGVLVLARGIINTTRRYLRRTGAGDSPFALNMGRTIDIDNGYMRTASGGVVVTETGYAGSMPAPPYVQVGV